MQRPATVPESAEYFPDWDEWGSGGKVDGEMHGDWRLWRGDGTYVEESSWRAGRCHGVKRRFHDDGTLSTIAEYEDGSMLRLTAFRPTNPTRDKDVDFDTLPAATVRAEFWCSTNRATGVRATYRQQFYDADGVELDPFGSPVPARPAGVPEHAWFNSSGGQWKAGRWTPAVSAIGVQAFWDRTGTLIHIEYHRDGELVAHIGQYNQGNPLVEAARDGDSEAVDTLLALGLGAAPGAAALAAYEGFPDLARRLTDPQPAGLVDARRQPERRPEVAPDAAWIAGTGSYGAWYAGTVDPRTGEPQGDWRVWLHKPYLDHDELVETRFEGGRPALRRTYGTVRHRRTEGREHRDGFLLKEEIRFGPYRQRRYEEGRLETETQHRDDGTVTGLRYHDDGAVETERVTRDGDLVVERWFGRDGTRLAEVRPVARRHHTSAGRTLPVELFTAYDASGAIIASGKVRAGAKGRPLGRWRVFGPDGTEIGRTTFKRIKATRDGRLGALAHTMLRWHAAPVPAALAGIESVPWRKLSTYFGTAKDFPFLLTGLTLPDPLAVSLAVSQMYDPALHQGTITEVTGPTARYVVAALGTVGNAALAIEPMRFLIMMATREGELGAAHAIKNVHRALEPGAKPGKHFRRNNTEPGYHEVLTAIDVGIPLWTRWAAHRNGDVRGRALLLLALAPDPAAGAILLDRLTTESDVDLRGDALLGLTLHEPTDAMRAVLAGHLAGADPLLRFCAALTWARHRLPADGAPVPAADVLLAALTDPAPLARFGNLFLGSGMATADAATALALLPSEEAERHVDRLAAAIDEVDAINAVSVTGALLDVVFPTEAYADGADLTASQRAALAAIAASDNAWTFNVNLHEVLRYNGLPADRDGLRDLAQGRVREHAAGSPVPSLPRVDAGIRLL